MSNKYKNSGFSLIEIMVVILIITTLSSLIIVGVLSARKGAKDTKRKAELSQIGRFFSISCYMPLGGGGEYDLADIINEIKVIKPETAKYIKTSPIDPKSGSVLESKYIYTVTNDGSKCALYANLEKANEETTLTTINTPTPGGGTGVLETAVAGWNGTNKYYQISN